jgi:hypothetical protein
VVERVLSYKPKKKAKKKRKVNAAPEALRQKIKIALR